MQKLRKASGHQVLSFNRWQGERHMLTNKPVKVPPVGVAMYTVCSLLDCPVEEYIVESIPFVLAVVGLVAVMLLWPGLVLFVPNALM